MFTLITGASGGIGYELARVFARHKHDLVLVARSEDKLHMLAEDLQTNEGIQVHVIPSDLSRPSAVAELVAVLDHLGVEVNILVNNAGVDVYGYFHETAWADELGIIQLNLVSLTELTKSLLPALRRQGSGRVLNVGSTGSFVPSPLNAVYSATKAYVWSFSVALSVEEQDSNISVTMLCPGAVRTGFQSRANIQNIRLLRFGVMQAAAVAEECYRGLMSGKLLVTPGIYTKFQVFASRLLPTRWLARMAKTMLEPVT